MRRKKWLYQLMGAAVIFAVLWLVIGAVYGKGKLEKELAKQRQGQGAASLEEEEKQAQGQEDENARKKAEKEREKQAQKAREDREKAERKSNPLLILVNKNNAVAGDWAPEITHIVDGYEGDPRAKAPLLAMFQAAEEEGITLMLCSAYRTYDTSKRLYAQEIQRFLEERYGQKEAEAEAARWVAPPGTSEHHTGLAFDIVTPSYQMLDHGFADTAAAKWLAKNAWEFGFVLRFPEDKQEITGITFEPWHYRYVGKEDAKKMQAAGLCLEEYLGE